MSFQFFLCSPSHPHPPHTVHFFILLHAEVRKFCDGLYCQEWSKHPASSTSWRCLPRQSPENSVRKRSEYNGCLRHELAQIKDEEKKLMYGKGVRNPSFADAPHPVIQPCQCHIDDIYMHHIFSLPASRSQIFAILQLEDIRKVSSEFATRAFVVVDSVGKGGNLPAYVCYCVFIVVCVYVYMYLCPAMRICVYALRVNTPVHLYG